MADNYLISTQKLCLHYNLELSFVNALSKFGLIEVKIIDQMHFIHQDQISDIEKIIRLHYELNINLEGIDIIFNLLQKQREMRNELIDLKNRLSFYEGDYML